MSSLHGLFPLVPAQRADLTVFFKVLQGIHDANGLVNAATQRHIIHQHVANNTLLVDEEQAAVCNLITLFCQHIELGCNILVDICNERIGTPSIPP